jgi:metal-dependent amidase/aminoacylase/carboxypeptidase family protein
VTPADRVRQVVDDRADQLLGLSHSIHADPEVGFEERRAAAAPRRCCTTPASR